MTQNIAYLQGMVGLDAKDPQYQYLRFPLVVGQKWTREYRTRAPGPSYGLYARRAEHRVVGVEQIATDAGAFRAFKIESELVTSYGGRGVYIYYYSPETKSVVKFTVTDTDPRGSSSATREVELIKFGTAP